jgi:hypothetical protein
MTRKQQMGVLNMRKPLMGRASRAKMSLKATGISLLIVVAQSSLQGQTGSTKISGAVWTGEPTSFHGAVFGGAKSETAAHFESREIGKCAVEKDRPEEACLLRLKLADVSTTGIMIFTEDKFVGVAVLFPSGKSSTIQQVFEQGYGQVQANGMGTQNWAGEKVSLILRANCSATDKDLIERIAKLRWSDADDLTGKLHTAELDYILKRSERANATRLENFQNAVLLYHQPRDEARRRFDESDKRSRDDEQRSLEDTKRRTELSNSEAQADYYRFRNDTYGVFMLFNNQYAVREAKRQQELLKSAADALK